MAVAAGLLSAVPEGAVLTIDSAPIIYYLENHPTYAQRFAPIFDAVTEGQMVAVISAITLAEVLTGPLRSGNEVLAAQYRETLCRSPGWHMHPVDEETAATAARIRLTYKLRLPDAIQVATAIVTQSYALVTHDTELARIKDIRVLGPS